MTPQPRPNLRSASRPGPAPTDRTWLEQAQPAYGGCLGAGLTIASGEVAAMVACLREAIAIRREEIERHRRLQTRDPIPEFNVLYGTDSKSCADEMEMHWESGTLLTIAKSKISPLAETYLHSRRELHDLNATFTLIKLPGHGGVYPMAAADACAKACHDLPARPVELVVHSTLAIPVALPANPQTLATGAAPHKWERLAGTPTPHAASSAHLQFAHARLQEAAAIEQLQRYIDSHDGAPYLAIDRAEAGLSPPEGCRRTRWVALLAVFNEGRWVYGAEDGTPNSATVALAVTGGGTPSPPACVSAPVVMRVRSTDGTGSRSAEMARRLRCARVQRRH